MQNIEEIIERFSKVKVLVVGDVMLDRYWWGSVSRISPEAPVPVVRLNKSSAAAGGAANVAANVVGLGAQSYLVGAVGQDPEAETLASILGHSKIDRDNLIYLENHQTTVKTRIIAHSQQVVRLDQENTLPIDSRQCESIFEHIERLMKTADVVILSDYAKGLLTENLIARLITTGSEYGIKILVDPKGKDYTKYKGATLLTPNQKEAAEACGFEESEPDIIDKAGKRLLEISAAEAILITQGEKGMTLFERNGKSSNLSALARNVYDVTGAGDTVIAAFAVAVAAGLSFIESAEIANIAAGLVVEQIGTTAITKEMLSKALDTTNQHFTR